VFDNRLKRIRPKFQFHFTDPIKIDIDSSFNIHIKEVLLPHDWFSIQSLLELFF
jgi:hypothetical protein